LILVAFLALGVIYSVATPIFEALDEKSHYPVVKHIADGSGLPVQDPAQPGPWLQEGSQPPLYYALMAAATFWINTDDLPELRKPNPHAQIGNPLGEGNKNLVAHTDREAFPWRGTALAVHLIRLLSLLLGAATVYLTYRLAQEVVPDQPEAAVLAAALVAFNPMFLFISASVNNDNLVIMLCALALFMMVRVLVRSNDFGRSTRQPLGDWGWLGIVLGLAVLTKLSALTLLPVAAVVLMLVTVRRRSWVALVGGGVAIFGPLALISGWWFWRNWTLYGEWTGINTMMAVIDGWRDPPLDLSGLLAEAEGFRLSFWGVFGILNILADRVVYAVYDVLTVLGVAGLLVWAVWRRSHIGLTWLPFLWFALNLASVVRWTMITMGSQGRLLFPSLSAIALALAVGLTTLMPRRQAGLASGVLSVGLAAIALIIPFRTILPAYARPPLLAEVPAGAQRIQVDYEDEMRLLGYQFEGNQVRPGEALGVTLYWQGLKPMTRDFSVVVRIYGRDDRPIGQVDSFPGQGNYPTRAWQPGPVIPDRYLVPIAPDALTPAQAQVEVGVYRAYSLEPVQALDPQGQPLGRALIGRVRLAAPTPPVYAPEHPVRFTLGGQAALTGYDLPPAIRRGAMLPLTLYWEGLTPMSLDYTVFVHLVDPAGQTIAQADGQPDGGNYPTGLWAPGEVVRDQRAIAIQAGAPPGVYRLRVGLYDLATGQRLPVQDEGGRMVPDGAIELATVEVKP